MKYLKLISFLLFVILLFSACGSQPAVSVTLVPAETPKPIASITVSPSPHISAALLSNETPKPSASAAAALAPIVTPKPSPSTVVSHLPQPQYDPQVTPGGLYDGDRFAVLPMSIPKISEADKKTFNPGRIFDYLATSSGADFFYTIVDCKVKEGRLYVTVSDTLYIDDASIAYYYIKNAFALTDEYLLCLPVFSEYAEEVEEGVTDQWSNPDLSGYKSKTIKSIPVSDEASIYLPEEYDSDIDTVQEFIKKIVNKNVKLTAMGYFQLDYEDGQITAISTMEDDEDCP